jgi:AraC-like DNA-binding protein
MPHKSHFRYLPVLAAQRQWGLYLTDCGYTRIDPGMPYPPRGHPEAYAFDWKQGRTLDEYDVVYITRGRGTFETRVSGRHAIEAGDVIVLFPGVWHRYTPDPKTGWDEQWIGFNGAIASQLMRAPFFQQKEPVLRIGVDESLRQRFIALFNDIKNDPAGAPLSGASRIIEILGLIQERVHKGGTNGRTSEVIRAAQNRILQQFDQPIDFALLSQSLGVSYTTFRRRFKQQTGVSPAQFQSAIRLNRARDLLASTDLPISEVATQTGFDSIFYFSQVFKKKTGQPPSDYRAESRGS